MTDSRSLQVGDKAAMTRAFSAEDVEDFARLSGDSNPIHLDAEYAAGTQFGQRIVHGQLVTSLFSTLLGVQLPGEGSIYVSQDSKFRLPVHLDEEVTATVEITAIREDKPFVTLKTTASNPKGKVVVKGEAVMYVPWLQA